MAARIPLAALACALTLACTAPAQELYSTLTGLRLDGRLLPFDAPIEVVVQTTRPRPGDQYLKPHLARVRVTAIAGVTLGDAITAWAAVEHTLVQGLALDTPLKLRAQLQDCGDALGQTSMLLAVEEHELAPIDLAAPTTPDLRSRVGERVELVATAWSRNDAWRLSCGELRLVPADAAGRTCTLADELHGCLVRASGQLHEQLRYTESPGPDAELTKQLVLFASKVERIGPRDATTGADRRPGALNALYEHAPRKQNGAFVLLPELAHLWTNTDLEARARSLARRNLPWLLYDVAHATPETRDELARRTGDASIAPPLRRIYAGMLAARDDERGRAFLLDCVEGLSPPDADAIFVLAAFDDWAPAGSCETAWTEAPLLRCLRAAPGETIGSLGCQKLARLGSRAAAARMLELLEDPDRVQDGPYSPAWLSPVWRLRRDLSQMPRDVVDVAMLERALDAPDPDQGERYVLEELLQRDATVALDRYLPRLDKGFYASYFRECIQPGNLAEIARRLDSLPPPARREAEYVLLHHAPDGAGQLVARIASDATPLRELWPCCCHLQLRDQDRARKTAATAARALRRRVLTAKELPDGPDAFAVQALLRFIGDSSEPDAIAEMVELLACDFGAVADEYVSTRGFHNLIADRLADMTGVSLGRDVDAWRKWLRDR